ncbi:MAG: tetratricopeptide repeat protein [Anaerolineae bacterium]|nr:tetratricopeptide repeat protein [Anaerolineae bacterium]
MANQVQTRNRINWRFFAAQVGIQTLLVVFFTLLLPDSDLTMMLLLAGGFYLMWSAFSKALLFREHRQGVRLTILERHDEAIKAFEQSFAFLSRSPWIDRFRWLVALDSSAVSYREMALCNIAYNYARKGDARQAKAYYEEALAHFPRSKQAQAGLLMIDSAVEDYRNQQAAQQNGQ